MGFRAFALAYLLGGITFLPLLVLIVAGTAWVLLPQVQPGHDEAPKPINTVDRELDTSVSETQESRSREQSITGDTSVSGTFAVLRRYDFQAASTALNARNAAGGQSGGNSNTDGSVTGDHGFNAPSESVYQSMYRSVFDRNKAASSTTSLLENDGATQQANGKPGKRKVVPANVLFIVLRHGHLMLYDSVAQVEVKHVISLAHYQISLQAGEGTEELEDGKKMREADLFIKRTAIVLRPIDLPYGTQRPGQQGPAKPFYLFSNINMEREDFYHALIATRSRPPIPRALDTSALIKLQSNLHSVSLTPETRAINALIGRVFLALHQTDELTNLVRAKIEKKLSRIQKPSFIPTLLVQSIEIGDAGPVFTNPRLRDLNISGDLTISADMRYNGGLSITLFAVAKLDLGPRFKARTVDLVLKTTIQRIQGTMLLRIKPPPSNRIWSCFEIMPEMEIRVEPVVSDRKITYGFVLRTIEDRLRMAIADGLVKPNWDDTPLPLVDTRGFFARGGIWVDEGQEEAARSRSPSEPEHVIKKHERTMSMPILVGDQILGTASTGVESPSQAETVPAKLKHTMSMQPDDTRPRRRAMAHAPSQSLGSVSDKQQPPAVLPRPLRSPSLTASIPSVAIDGQNVEPVRADDLSLRQASTQTRRMWRSRGSDTTLPPKDALEELRVVHDRAEQAISRPSDAGMAGGNPGRPGIEMADDTASADGRQLLDAASLNGASPARSFALGRTNSDRSMTESIASTHSQQSQQRKQTIMAATAAATTAARNWGWNAIQRNKGALPRGLGKRETQPSLAQTEPMGRGQPLPPPGVPLPGPQKAGWSGMGNLRRKPVPALPPRRPLDSRLVSDDPASAEASSDLTEDKGPEAEDASEEMDDEFGPWRENSGTIVTDDNGLLQAVGNTTLEEPDETPTQEHFSKIPSPPRSITEKPRIDATSATPDETKVAPKKMPPPLPARRRASGASPAENKATSSSDTSLGPLDLQGGTMQDQSDNECSLRVPDAAAAAVAAENATPALAQGATDDITDLNKTEVGIVTAEGVAQSPPEEDIGLGLDERPASAEEELKRVETKDRFARGEDLGEGDFGQHDERRGMEHESESGATETNDIATEAKQESQQVNNTVR